MSGWMLPTQTLLGSRMDEEKERVDFLVVPINIYYIFYNQLSLEGKNIGPGYIYQDEFRNQALEFKLF